MCACLKLTEFIYLKSRKRKTNSTFCVVSWYSKELSCVCVFAGARGVSVPHYFYSGGVPEGNSLRLALPPKRLPEERLESAGLHHRSCRVRRKMIYIYIYRMMSFLGRRGGSNVCNTLPGFLKVLANTVLNIRP